ncbi:hypothetical protein F5Y05DRAFT_48968 [Hypoxylon sp. FL0543]|nr:hypothetical protein F5Y05DRAFT_48968 [Hypoxylon sp. FL0543]
MTQTSCSTPSDRCWHYSVWSEVCGTGPSVLDRGASCSSFSGFEFARPLGSAVLDRHLPKVPSRLL